MTQLTDPGRWTAAGSDAPEGLREVFAAGRAEGPNAAQMRALSLKLAAATATGVGAAAAAGVAKPAAATTWASIKSALAGTKLVGAITVASAVTLGGAVAYRSSTNQTTFRSGNAAAAIVGEPAEEASPALSAPAAGTESVQTHQPTLGAPTFTPVVTRPEPATPTTSVPAAPSAAPARAPVREARGPAVVRERAAAGQSARQPAARASSGEPPATDSAPAGQAAKSELGLLREAQLALVARPREAYALTQQHRAQFPRGQFAEERDALAIQALLRIGERDVALDLAERFVTAHPSSAHAQPFRELLQKR